LKVSFVAVAPKYIAPTTKLIFIVTFDVDMGGVFVLGELENLL